MKHGINDRRSGALQRLEAQLKSGVKPNKKGKKGVTPLTDSDIKRIKKEIEVLTKKLK